MSLISAAVARLTRAGRRSRYRLRKARVATGSVRPSRPEAFWGCSEVTTRSGRMRDDLHCPQPAGAPTVETLSHTSSRVCSSSAHLPRRWNRPRTGSQLWKRPTPYPMGESPNALRASPPTATNNTQKFT